MDPKLEVVDVGGGRSFTAWMHGLPYRTVRWHFHPEYEIHLVTATQGTFFVGDSIGSFAPSQLVMVGPNLPHNWVSDVPQDQSISERSVVVQFQAERVKRLIDTFPELRDTGALLSEAGWGVLFGPDASVAAASVMREMVTAEGAHRVRLFLSLLEILTNDRARQRILSCKYHVGTPHSRSARINLALAYIAKHLTGPLRESDLAALTGQSVSSFSRSFRRHVGLTFVQYVNHLRVRTSCELLNDESLTVTDVCYLSGFNNLSNFNRQFLALKGMPPSRFRQQFDVNRRQGLAS